MKPVPPSKGKVEQDARVQRGIPILRDRRSRDISYLSPALEMVTFW